MTTTRSSATSVLTRGIASGLLGTVVMTAFQKLVEMPLTGRGESYAPADLAETLLPVEPGTAAGRRRLNNATHLALGVLWGTAHGLVAQRGLRGQVAVHAVFGVVYPGDVLLNTALGLYHPRRWSRQDLVVDLVDKYVQAQATGLVFDRFLGPGRGRRKP